MINFPDMMIYLNAVVQPLFWLIIVALLDLLFGVLLSVIRKRFTWERLTDYLVSNGLPILAWLIAEFVLLMPAELVPEGLGFALDGIGWVIYSTIMLKILASLFGHFASLGLLTNAFGKLGIKSTDLQEMERLNG